MIYEIPYYQQTEKLIEFYKDKNNSTIKEYLLTVNNYVNELKNTDYLKIIDEFDYEKAFQEVLSLVYETYRPNHFNSVIDNANLRLFSDEFIVYILSVKKQLKKPIKWIMLCELQYKFSILEIQFKIKTGFKEDFTKFAIDKITLTELWTIKID